ncbi:MAG TPA: hypothetical protein DCM54_03180 [Gammaproteobacteria bacterium]|nr:hypothetical protein [Gammaproteobacteria bacterium]
MRELTQNEVKEISGGYLSYESIRSRICSSIRIPGFCPGGTTLVDGTIVPYPTPYYPTIWLPLAQ